MNLNIFILSNCFNQYEIISSKVIELYVKNSLKKNNLENTVIKTFFNDTPFALYSLNMNQGTSTGSKSSKQFQMFIIILSLVSVCVYRIWNSITIYANQGVVPIAGFSTLYGIANTLNTPCFMWSDDMRATWGITSDPLVVGTSPYFFKDISSDDAWQKNLFGSYFSPVMGTDIKCPSGNTFIDRITYYLNVDINKGVPSGYLNTLITLGESIVNYVETDKISGPKGWDISVNTGLYYDLSWVITNISINLLDKTQQIFIKDNNKDFDQVGISNIQTKLPSRDNIVKSFQKHLDLYNLNLK